LIENGYTIEEYIMMYLTSTFIVAIKPNKIDEAKKIVQELHLNINVIGKVIPNKKIIISNGEDKVSVFDFEKKKYIY
jgi:selenophosphate synthetase-related protein